jgi:hypothetical protein
MTNYLQSIVSSPLLPTQPHPRTREDHPFCPSTEDKSQEFSPWTDLQVITVYLALNICISTQVRLGLCFRPS